MTTTMQAASVAGDRTIDTTRDLAALHRRSDRYRRIFDITASLVLLLVALPIITVTALGSAIALRAWPFFAQDRVGRDGRTFRFLKVRTLRPDVPAYTDKHRLDRDHIPTFCRLLRLLHLDELPQLLLVLRGHMSLVGPRPEMPYLHDAMQPSFATTRTSIRPGCTGLWQVSEACTELIHVSPEYDRFYVEHRSLRLDLWIALRTGLQMLGLGRCITLADVPDWALVLSPADVIDLREVIDLRDATANDAVLSLPATAGR